VRQDTIRELMAFGLIGGAAALGFVAGSTWLLSQPLPVPDWLASSLLYAAFIVPTYLAHRRFTFATGPDHGRALPRYVAGQVCALAVASLAGWLAYHWLMLAPLAGAMLVTAASTATSYLLSKFWAFAAAPASRSA
jgi:putative flippase GtrA